MFLANQDPDADLAVMERARWNLQRLAPEKVGAGFLHLRLCRQPGKNRGGRACYGGFTPMGRTQLQLSAGCDGPATGLALTCGCPLYMAGGLKKNFATTSTLTPAPLPPGKIRQMAQKSGLVAGGGAHTDAGNGFTTPAARPIRLRACGPFSRLAGMLPILPTAVLSTNLRDLSRLWGHLQRALELDLRVLNLATLAAQRRPGARGRDRPPPLKTGWKPAL